MIDSLKLCRVAFIAVTLSSASFAFAGPSVDSVEMQKALAKVDAGPDELRRFVQRTKPIYQLDYTEVMQVHFAKKALAANASSTPQAPTVSTALAGDRK